MPGPLSRTQKRTIPPPPFPRTLMGIFNARGRVREGLVEVILLSALSELPWAQLLVNGLALGSLYALAAFGIVLIFKTTDVITFAQGEMAMFCAFIAFTLITALNLPFVLAFVLTLLFASVFGAVVERVVIRRVSATSHINPVIATVGLALILLGVAGRLWGYEVRAFPAPVVGPPFRLGTVVLSQLNALILGVMLLLVVNVFHHPIHLRMAIGKRAEAFLPVEAALHPFLLVDKSGRGCLDVAHQTRQSEVGL